MEIEVEEDVVVKEARESVENILKENKLLSMATASENKPHINTAFYAAEGLKLYIFTPPETVHGQNLEENLGIAVDIHDSHQEWSDEKKGLQIFGTAEKKNTEKALRTYSEKFPAMRELATELEELQQYDSELYMIRPEKIKIFDEPRFGKETWINVNVRN